MNTDPAKPTGKPKSNTKEFLIFISIPLSIILVVSMFLVVPSWISKPKYDFLYTNCSSYDCLYDVTTDKDGNIIQTNYKDTVINSYNTYNSPDVYYYNVHNNSSRRIDLTDAKAYKLDTSNISPDGYTLTQGGSSDSGFLFWGYSSDYSWYLKSGNLKKKHVNLQSNGYSSGNLKLLGWVEKWALKKSY